MAWWHFGKKSKQQKPTPIKLPASSEPYSPPLSPDSVPPTRSTQDAGNLHSLTSASVPARQSTEKTQPEDPEELHPAERRESQDEDITALPGAPQHHEFDSGPHLRSIGEFRQTTPLPNLTGRLTVFRRATSPFFIRSKAPQKHKVARPRQSVRRLRPLPHR